LVVKQLCCITRLKHEFPAPLTWSVCVDVALFSTLNIAKKLPKQILDQSKSVCVDVAFALQKNTLHMLSKQTIYSFLIVSVESQKKKAERKRKRRIRWCYQSPITLLSSKLFTYSTFIPIQTGLAHLLSAHLLLHFRKLSFSIISQSTICFSVYLSLEHILYSLQLLCSL
jgi:hypothetical protein